MIIIHQIINTARQKNYVHDAARPWLVTKREGKAPQVAVGRYPTEQNAKRAVTRRRKKYQNV